MSNDSKAALVTGKADRKPQGKKVLDEITIRPANNGFTVKNRYKEEGKESYMSNFESVDNVFQTPEALMEHLSGEVGAKQAEKESGKVEKSEKGGYVQGRAEREK